ncbi:MAG: hypothetical protein MRK01_13745 [Candidatus Scalindua sp.]|nr:hypothetical protein [Candidatus Scalindua sp.]
MSDNVENNLRTLKGRLQTIEEAIEKKAIEKNEYLKTSQEEIIKKTKEIEKKTKEKNTLKGDITNLEKIRIEINQISDAYKQGLKSIQKDTTEIENYLSLKESMLEIAVKDKKDKIISKIQEVDESIHNINEEVKALEKALQTAQEGYRDAKVNRDKSQINYNSFKAKQKDIEDKLKKLKDLKQLIVKEEDGNNNTTNMYFFIQDIKMLFEETKSDILSVEDFKQKLLEAWNGLDANEMSVRAKESLLEEAKKKLNEKQKALETARKDRNQLILEILKTI